jgi:hypothetical protein
MSTTTAIVHNSAPLDIAPIERVLIQGDLSQLKPEERVAYVKAVCDSLGINWLTRPFEYLELPDPADKRRKITTLYARKDCTDQLRNRNAASSKIVNREVVEGVYIVTARATCGNREEESIGAVPLVKEGGKWKNNGERNVFEPDGTFIPLRPEERANAMMKAETKAKRRATLSLFGLGFTDESEIETIRGARVVDDMEGKLLAAPAPEKGPAASERSPRAGGAARARGATAPPPQASQQPPEGASVDDLMPPAREIPEELRDAVAKLRAGDFSVIKVTSEYLQKEMIEAAGRAGEESYMRTIGKLRERFPKGTAIPTEDMLNTWLTLWEDLQAAITHKKASEFVDGIGDPVEVVK